MSIACYELFHMDKTCFVTFYDDLRRHNYVGDSRDMCLEEVTITLFILAYNTPQRCCKSFSTFLKLCLVI